MARRAVLFDLGGVLFGPGLQHFLGSCEREWGLPRNFLWDVLLSGGSQSSYSRALRGQITLSQLFSEVDEGCRRRASSLGIAIPGAFSAARPFQDLQAQGSVDVRMLRVAGILRWNGFKTCALTNNWVDDSDGRSAAAALLERLRRHFDLVLESCRIGMCQPDPGIYSYALEALQAQPQEAILLDDQAENLAAARDLGMATILVRDPDSALRELQELSGVQLLGQEEPLPIPCDPAGVTHGYVSIRPGVRLHFVELGQGPVLCLCHGFPESWLSWRFQIPALADAGFRVIALEMKGYGESTAPADIPEYSQERICEDFVTFLDKLVRSRPGRVRFSGKIWDFSLWMGIPQVVLVGHDWGGAVAWNVALFYPERLRAVASLNTPYRPADPGVDIMEKLGSSPAFDYQLYFQEPGVAEAELEKDVGRTLKILIRSSRVEDRLPFDLDFHRVRERGGLLVGFPENPPGSRLLPPAELEYYSQQFRKSGFRGPLNWYRNMRANWSWALSARDRKIPIPALMVTAGKDPVLHPGLSKGMESWPRIPRDRPDIPTGNSPSASRGAAAMVQGQGGVKFQNWAGTYGSSPELFFRPRSVDEIREILELARQRDKRVKVVGGGHSPSDIACSEDFMIHMGKINRILQVDKDKQQVTVEAGILLSELNLELDKHGMALANLGAVSEVTAAGVIGTGTHNTGIDHGILPTQVLDQLEEHLRRSQYFRFLWFPHSENVRIIYQDPTSKPPCSSSSWFWDYAVGYYLLEFLLWISSFIPGLVAWINRGFFWLLFNSRVENVAQSHRIFSYECRFRQHVQDWAIPIGKTKEALLELKAALERNPELVAHFPVEIRFSRGDEILLSPCFRRDSCYINVIMYRPYGKDIPRLEYWRTYERIMKKHGGRPHWAKAHSCTRKDLEKMYPAFPKFCAIREKLDPTGIFLNAYLEKVFY
ncbi:bifunctional epoxide hydrolase 2 isoform X3 [Corvus moneduloides]|uniref:bifunctional epoxide hydrolase 2 isoform X3 n=1 Tax=Corvus moneduloides TaxID=1196302 RepID=UPI00136240BF|nr:bifunctional epoxide hydrolase 2 isoform X3 [Corvus moneduloides]